MSNKVLLVDDHPAMLMALRSMLLNQVLFEVVGQAINGEDCLKEIKKTNPDILILDLDERIAGEEASTSVSTFDLLNACLKPPVLSVKYPAIILFTLFCTAFKVKSVSLGLN